MLGTWVDGTPGKGGKHTGSWSATPGVPFRQFVEDSGAYYASKGMWEDRKSATRRRRGGRGEMVDIHATGRSAMTSATMSATSAAGAEARVAAAAAAAPPIDRTRVNDAPAAEVAETRRRILYGWNRSPPATQTLPRIVTYHPDIRRLVFSPPPELASLRLRQLPSLPNGTALQPNVATPVSGNLGGTGSDGSGGSGGSDTSGGGNHGSGWAPGVGRMAEVRVRWQRPSVAARLSLNVNMDAANGADGLVQGSHSMGVNYVPPPTAATGAAAGKGGVGGGGGDGGGNDGDPSYRSAPAYNVTVDGGGDDGLWLLPTDDVIELVVFVDNTVVEAYWMDGRVVNTAAIGYSATGGGMAVEASVEVVLESVQAWELGSCWVNESVALQMIERGAGE